MTTGNPFERVVCAAAGGFLLLSSARNRKPWRYLMAGIGAELIRRSISGAGGVHEWVQRIARGRTENDIVDELSEQSFPASDAPATY